jgi:ribonuclease HI
MAEIYTDGSGFYKAGDGGWSCIVRFKAGDDLFEAQACGHALLTTNNRMEMGAALAGLYILGGVPADVTIISDSLYVVDGFNQYLPTWLLLDQVTGRRRCNPSRPNADLWDAFLMFKQVHKIHFAHVRGHTGHPENEACDVMAGAARVERKSEVIWKRNGKTEAIHQRDLLQEALAYTRQLLHSANGSPTPAN